jgi:hypothetical protein
MSVYISPILGHRANSQLETPIPSANILSTIMEIWQTVQTDRFEGNFIPFV